MQPITQASLDPNRNDIKHFRVDQEFCGSIGYFGLILRLPRLFHSMRARPANRTTTRVPAARGPLLARQLTMHRSAELLAGY
jgi:hypothetical protein